MSRYAIIGGGAGGAAAAARLRRLDENAEIVIFERSQYVSSANCGLPYYIGNAIKDRDKLIVRTPEDFLTRFNIRVKTGWEVTEIDRQSKSLRAVNRVDSSEMKMTYDACVLSPGAEPVRPPIPGIDLEGVCALRTIPDCDLIRKYADTKGIRSGLVIGAGFIGMEMAENLYDLGLDVTVVEMADQVLTPVDKEIAAVIQFHMKCKGVRFYTNARVLSIEKEGTGLKAGLQNGDSISSDIVIVSAGVRPETRLAVDAGLELGGSGAIKVGASMRTTDVSIYALGDAVEVYNPVTDSYAPCYLAGPAVKQARVVAENIVRGGNAEYKGALGTAIAKIFDLTVARTGATEGVLKKAGIPYSVLIDNPYQHAGYYPYPRLMLLKLMFCPKSGRILGASAAGREGIDKRMDVISAILGMNGNVKDLAEFEQAYAPPYSAAKDPVNMLGFIAENVMDGLVKMVTPKELSETDREDFFLIDVRTEEEYGRGNIDGAVNIPLDGFRDNIDEIPRNKPVYVYCEAGLRAYIAGRILLQNGFDDVFDLTGGYIAWQFFNQTGRFLPHIHGSGWKESCAAIIGSKIDCGTAGGNFPAPVDLSSMNREEISLGIKICLAEIMERDILLFCSDNAETFKMGQSAAEQYGQIPLVLSEQDPFVFLIKKK